MNTKIVKNIQTTISGEEIGCMVISWDMQSVYQADAWAEQFDNLSRFNNEERTVSKIHSVEYQVFDKVGIDITPQIISNTRLTAILEDKLIEAVETETLEDLETQTA